MIQDLDVEVIEVVEALAVRRWPCLLFAAFVTRTVELSSHSQEAAVLVLDGLDRYDIYSRRGMLELF